MTAEQAAQPLTAFPPRPCPRCDALERVLVHAQRFERLSAGSLLSGYDVVVCTKCDLGFADRIPEQAAFDEYYRRMSKYENQHQGGVSAPYLEQTYDAIAEFVSRALPDRDASLLDVGCATGALLAAFQRRGYDRLLGLDPSPVCARAAADLYAIEVRPQTISEVVGSSERFDCVILSSVLEHVHSIRESLTDLSRLLRPGGLLFIEVPDATRFAEHMSAPYQQFSMEHINFFTPTTLIDLCDSLGLRLHALERPVRTLGTAGEPAVTALFRRDSRRAEHPADESTRACLDRYVAESRLLDEDVRARIATLQRGTDRFFVWGAGTHTLRLLAADVLRTESIEGFIDSNPRYQGHNLAGVPVLPPSALEGRTTPIVISSRVFQEEIRAMITENLQYQGRIITLY